MIKTTKKATKDFILKAVFKDDKKKPEGIVEKQFAITDDLSTKISYVYLGEKSKFDRESAWELALSLAFLKRTTQVELATFVTEKISQDELAKIIFEQYQYSKAELFSAKTEKKESETDLILLESEKTPLSKETILESSIKMEAVNFSRKLQITPPNICNSEWLADVYKKELSKNPDLKVKVLNKKDIEKEKMGLLLSVNRGSMYEPRVVVVEYKGNPKSKEVTAFIGKGITFDSGGYNIKTGTHMSNMKYDMSGSAIVAGTLKVIAMAKPKANFVAVLPLTDNRLNGDASTPDSVWTSMSGKTVEINNTDAEGRLILADGMTYAIKKLKATRLVTVATLTGAIVVSLGDTYTGMWSTNEETYQKFLESSDQEHELLWRLPFHKNFVKYIKGSTVADLRNTDYSGKGGGSISAAMFLKEFAEDKDYTHFDIAGTASKDNTVTGVLVKTLSRFAKNI